MNYRIETDSLGEVRVDDVNEFSEIACAKGGLCRIRGSDVMNIMMDFIFPLKLIDCGQ